MTTEEPTIRVPVSEIETLKAWRERGGHALPVEVYDLIDRIPSWVPPMAAVLAVEAELEIHVPDISHSMNPELIARNILRRLHRDGFDVVPRDD